ncbi:MAG: hypothetical protein ACSHYB_05145 [Roseibacillus sp.]
MAQTRWLAPWKDDPHSKAIYHVINRVVDRRSAFGGEIQRFKSVIVQNGTASRTVAAYIDLNPVRAGIVEDPADYRWSSYGEAMGGGKKARAGLVKALGTSHSQHSRTNVKVSSAARAWAQGGIGKEYRKLLLRAGQEVVLNAKVVKKGMSKEKVENELAALDESTSKSDRVISKVIQHRIRYFSDGVVIGSKDSVETFFNQFKHRFGPKRTTGAHKPRGALFPL